MIIMNFSDLPKGKASVCQVQHLASTSTLYHNFKPIQLEFAHEYFIVAQINIVKH